MLYRKSILMMLTVAMIAAAPRVQAQLSVTTDGVPVTEDFTGYTATGLSPAKAGGAGELDSNEFEVIGMSGGNFLFGATVSGMDEGDAGRGVSSGGVTTGGLYAFNTGVSAGDPALGIQPGGSDMTPGSITLRVDNNSGSALDTWAIGYTFLELNNTNRAQTMQLAVSTDNVSFADVGAALETIEAGAGSPIWVVNAAVSETGVLATVPNGGSLYIRWTTDDLTGTLNRPEIAIDDISVTGTFASATATVQSAVAFDGDIVVRFDLDPGAVGAGDFTLTGNDAQAIAGVSGSGNARTLSVGTALTVGDSTLDNIAVAATAGTNATNVNFYIYPPISIIQDGTIATGSQVGLRATVTARKTARAGTLSGEEYAIATSAGANNGIFVDDVTNNAALDKNDQVDIVGTVEESFTLTRIGSVTQFANGGVVAEIAPTVVPAADFQFDNVEDASPAEQWEGVLITIQETLTNATDVLFGEIGFDEGVHTDDMFYDAITQGDITFGGSATVTGVGYFSFSQYKVVILDPRSGVIILGARDWMLYE